MAMPSHIEPMLAKTGRLPRDGDRWGYEFKWDGIRAIVYWDGKRIRIESRNLLDITFRYPELADLGKRLRKNAILDGEIVAPDSSGRPSFSILQQRMLVSEKKVTDSLLNIKVYYYVFDILYLNSTTLMDRAYQERRRVLEGLNIAHPFCKVPPSSREEGKAVLSVARKHGLEGIVCKRLDGVYVSGRRSADWLKVKIVKSDEFVICGFRYARETRDRIGSLQMGIYDRDGKLRFVGGVGTGFSAPDHEALLSRLVPLRTTANPFDEKLDKDVIFVEPRYVAEIEYRRWPENGTLQQASYKGLRPDKSPNEIRMKE